MEKMSKLSYKLDQRKRKFSSKIKVSVRILISKIEKEMKKNDKEEIIMYTKKKSRRSKNSLNSDHKIRKNHE